MSKIAGRLFDHIKTGIHDKDAEVVASAYLVLASFVRKNVNKDNEEEILRIAKDGLKHHSEMVRGNALILMGRMCQLDNFRKEKERTVNLAVESLGSDNLYIRRGAVLCLLQFEEMIQEEYRDLILDTVENLEYSII